MRIALVGPELEENLALRYIHASLVHAGHEPCVLDFHCQEQLPSLVQDVLDNNFAMVGLSMVFTARSNEYVDLIRLLRSEGYRGTIVAGGHFASFHARQLLQDVPGLDGVLHGEGEQAMIDLAACIERPLEVLGATWRTADGEIIDTAPRPPLDDLDALPWPSRFGYQHRYLGLPIANVLAGRGCFASCSFCSINAWHRKIGGKRFRQRSVANLVAEMAALYHQRGIRIFNFHDDNFFLPRHEDNVRRFGEMRQALDRAGVGRIGIQVKARPDSIRQDVVDALLDLGLFRVFLGVENNAVSGLSALGRAVDRQTNHRALEMLLAADVHVTFNLLMFEPECTLADVRENAVFMRQYAQVPLNSCRVEAYEGTPIMDRLRTAGRLIGDYFGYTYRMTDPRSELAYQLFRRVFSPRNFRFDGTNLRGMAVDYELHVLSHFWPRQATPRLKSQARRLISDLNVNNSQLLTEILDFAEHADLADAAAAQAFGAELSHRREAFDHRMSERMTRVLTAIEEAAKERPAVSGLKAAASVAAATLLLSAAGCDSDHDATHVYEMAPTPTQPLDNAANNAANSPGNNAGNITGNVGNFNARNAPQNQPYPPVVDPVPPDLGNKPNTHPSEFAPPENNAGRRVEMDDEGTPDTQPRRKIVFVQPHMSEMVAVEPPSRPATEPATQPTSGPTTTSQAATTSQPTSRPDLPEYDKKTASLIASLLTGDPGLNDLAQKHGLTKEVVPVFVELDEKGQVTSVSVMADPAKKDFIRQAEKRIKEISFGKVLDAGGAAKAGKATVDVRFRQRPHMYEMAPTHMREMAPRNLRDR